MECVCAALDLMWPDPLSRPGILFYHLACRLLEYRLLHPHLGWLMCRYIVDRLLYVTVSSLFSRATDDVSTRFAELQVGDQYQ